MKTYDINWNGIDRGHEGVWSPSVWRMVLNAFAKFSPVDLNDKDSLFYTELQGNLPDIQWITALPDGSVRTYFRDGREPWAATGVVDFSKGAATITSVGRQVVEGKSSYAEVLASALLSLKEKNEYPIAIILDAMRHSPDGKGLVYDDVIRVMRHYRPGDNLAEALTSPIDSLKANNARRLRAILLLMVYSGLSIKNDDVYYAGQDISSLCRLDGDDLRNAFKHWILANNADGSGKAASYLIALEDVDAIARFLNDKFKVPSVYEMSETCLESLRDYILSEQSKEDHGAGTSTLNSVEGLHGKSYWQGGHCSAALGALVEFKRNWKNVKDFAVNPVDLLAVAFELFVGCRKKFEWCSDKVDGGATELREGYVANKKLRAAMPMTNNLGTDAQVVQWFKDYSYPDGKSWLDGIDTNGCAAFGGYINYLVAGGAAVARPEKFTRSLESAVKAIVKPASECFYNKDIHSVLKYLGLLGFEFKEDFDEDDYQDALHAQRVIKRRLKDMGEKQIVVWDAAANQAKPNDKDPDFLTVNEFLWFVNENKQEISKIAKEKAMAKQQKKPTKDKVTTGTATISGLLANKEDSLMTMLSAALLTKPLVILAGVSGTGKSRMVRHLAYKTCLDKDLQPQGGNAPGNFKMIQVKPNWHDSADLLGYRSVVSGNHEFVTTEFVKFVLKAHAYPDTPFFVCLDEMNLAPVEHYFAEFLSACESIRKNEQGVWISDPIVSPTDFDGEIVNLGGDVKFESDDATLDAALKARKALIEKEGLFIPRNLFVVGTVNMDDTTNGFSRKVLDRAMTIEMNEVHYEDLQKDDKGLTDDPSNMFTKTDIGKFIDRPDFDGPTMLKDDFRDQMETLRKKLEETPFALAYRFARETTLYRVALQSVLDQTKVVLKADNTPKLDASNNSINAERACGEIALDHMIRMKLLPRLTGTVTERGEVLKDIREFVTSLIKEVKVSDVKQKEMEKRANLNGGYLSFWP